MPQELNVLCCYACGTYQGQIVKKSNKWQCKICGEKQSIQVVYFRGSGIDCRHQVQHLNSAKAANSEKRPYSSPTIDVYGLDCAADENDDTIDRCQCPKRLKHSNGKWSHCLGSTPSSSSSDEKDDSCVALDDKENSASHQNPDFLRNLQKLRCSTRSSSFPGTRDSDVDDATAGPRASGSKTRTYPLTERSRKVYDKYDEYLTKAGDKSNTELKTDRSSGATFSCDKKLPSKWDKFLEIPKDERSFEEPRSGTKPSCGVSNADVRNDRSSSSDHRDSSSDIQARGPASRNNSLFERSSKGCEKGEFSDSRRKIRNPSPKNDFSVSGTPRFDKKTSSTGHSRDGQGSSREIEENSNNNSTTNNRQSARCNIFEDCNDDLDLTVDF